MRKQSTLVAGSIAVLLTMACQPLRAVEPLPVKLALFAFELDDRSAAGGLIAKDAIDDGNLGKATEEARKALTASGRYEVVDTAPVASEMASAGGVQRCNGCEAALGERLGAERSMVGLFARVSRTEYTLQIVVRDTRTGAILSNAFSGLRMGANYAWPRAVASLINDKILQ
jgi:Protein of unknown function (DUF2380)